MTWFGWVFLASQALNVVGVAYMTGRPRKQLDGGDVIMTLLVNSLIFWGAYAVGVTP